MCGFLHPCGLVVSTCCAAQCLAAERGRVEILRMLLRARAETKLACANSGVVSPLHLAASRGHARAIEVLVDVGGMSVDYVVSATIRAVPRAGLAVVAEGHPPPPVPPRAPHCFVALSERRRSR